MRLTRIIETVANEFQRNALVNKVTVGDVTDIALDKNEDFPLVHISPSSIDYSRTASDLTLSIFIVSPIDETDTTTGTEDDLFGYSSEEFVIEKCAQVAIKGLMSFEMGALSKKDFEFVSAGSIEPFVDDYRRKLAGVSFTVTFTAKNDVSACNGVVLERVIFDHTNQNAKLYFSSSNFDFVSGGDGSVSFIDKEGVQTASLSPIQSGVMVIEGNKLTVSLSGVSQPTLDAIRDNLHYIDVSSLAVGLDGVIETEDVEIQVRI